jgi:protein-disulfide isomerase
MAVEEEKLKSTNRALIIVLIIAAFFLGSLTNKVAMLQNNGTANNAPQPTQAPSDANAKPVAGKVTPISAADHIKGNKNAKVTILVYSDFECPFCKTFNPTANEIVNFYGDKVRMVFRQYPLPFHANAQKEAEASECVASLGGNDAFWKFVDAIFERTTANGTGFALDKLGPLAAELGVNQQEFQSCLDSGKYEKLVKDSITNGQTGGVSGTPSSFIMTSKGNELVVGAQPIDAFKTAIDKALAN